METLIFKPKNFRLLSIGGAGGGKAHTITHIMLHLFMYFTKLTTAICLLCSQGCFVTYIFIVLYL